MSKPGAYGDCLGEAFGLGHAPAFTTQTLRKTTIAATELKCDTAKHGRTQSIPEEDAYLVALQVREYPVHEFWVDGKSIKAGPYAAGETVIYDVRSNPIADLQHPFHSVFFYLPRTALNMIADGADAPQMGGLRSSPESGIDDPVMRHLAAALLPAFGRPEQASTLFVDYVTLAVAAHVAHRYCGMRPGTRPARGGLAPWQERLAKEILSANLSGEVSLSQLAGDCELSLGHFTRAFRASTGMPPHQWLLHRRIDEARDLLRNSAQALSEIALACGFADQSHFTATFTRVVGTSPGTWRRTQKD